MIEYELFYLVGESLESEKDTISQRVVAIVEAEGGTFLTPQTEEKRKLAYEVKGESRGTYLARRFTLPNIDEIEETQTEERALDFVHPLEKMNRQLQLDKGVLRFMIVKSLDLPELKAIERVERPKTDRRGYEKRHVARSAPQAPVTPVTEADKAVTNETIDEQLKSKLDI
jgi:ribosomal protein S6